MKETIYLLLFCAVLLICIIANFPILIALVIGLGIFFIYGLQKGYHFRQLIHMSWEGIRTARNILMTFAFIGALTGLWRLSGTIPVIICYAMRLMQPSLFLVGTFLLNCIVSFLTGTAFGTAATMGVICTSLGTTLQISPILTGGAVLSGVYFGDRCSPVSTSALLVAELTGTNIFANIKNMIRTALVPFLVTAILYTMIGLTSAHTQEITDTRSLFEGAFRLHPLAMLPALVVLVLSAARFNVRTALGGSILTAIPICLLLQGATPATLLRSIVMGYTSADPQVAAMMNGGGITSMLRVAAIVCLSSSYAGIFRGTGMLDNFQHAIKCLGRMITPFGATLCTSAVTSMIACNQTLSIMLTSQICSELEVAPDSLAIYLENSAVLLAPLIPWSIASGVPLSSIGAPTGSITVACYLYMVPLWQLVIAFIQQHTSADSKIPRNPD